MKMIQLITSIAIFIALLLFIGNLSVSFKPFSVFLPYWHRSLGIFLMIIAIVIYSLGEYGQGYKKGLKRGSEIAIEAIDEHLKEKEHDI